MRDEAIRARIQQALDKDLAALTLTSRQKEELFEQIAGGKPVKKKIKFSMGLALALLLALLVLGAAAAMLLSAQEVIEKNAVPMAAQNDTATRRTESYTNDQLVALIKAANENGITLDESTGIMRALRKGEGYWEDEAIMEICREAFGGLIYEWKYDEQYWFMGLMALTNGYESDMPYPGPEDLTAEKAWAAADRQLTAAYPEEAQAIADPLVYRRQESFGTEEDGRGVWYLVYQPSDLEHTKFIVTVDREGQADISPDSRDWTRFTVAQLNGAVNEAYRAVTGTKYSWSQEAWHAFSEKLPRAERTEGWSMEYDGYLLQAYPLPREGEVTAQQARAIAMQETQTPGLKWEQVLMAQGEERIWKVTAGSDPQESWEIDAQTGNILRRILWQPGDAVWQAYMLDSSYRQVRGNILTGTEALQLAAQAAREALKEDIPFENSHLFEARVNFLEQRGYWQLRFRTKTTAYGNAEVRITEPDHGIAVVSCEPSQVDGDTLYHRYKEAYGANRWTQDIWVRFAADMQRYTPTSWEGKLLKATSYPEAGSVEMTRAQAVDIAFSHNEIREEEELDATLIAADPHPVWKVVLGGEAALWMYEIDTATGQVLDKEMFKPDNYAFDNPLKRYTLHRDYALAFVAEFGMERLAEIEVTKYAADMTMDEPEMPLGPGGETVEYTPVAGDHTVTFQANAPGADSYRVTFTPGWMTQSVETLKP